MKLTLSPSRDQSLEKYPHLSVSVEDARDDICIDDVIGMFRALLLAAGYLPEAVNQYLGEE